MAFGSWEVPPDWSAPDNPPAAPEDWASHLAPPPDEAAGTHHRTPTSSTDWTNRLLPPTDDAAITHRAPSTPDYWASGRLSDLDDEATMLGFGDFLGFDPLRPAAFAASPPFFDQFASDSLHSTAEFPVSGHPASDPGDAVPPRGGAVGPGLADGTSPAAGLDGVDPRRARKPFGE
jgi:hypothetical protein